MRLIRAAIPGRRRLMPVAIGILLCLFSWSVPPRLVSAADDPYRQSELEQLLAARDYAATESLARQVLTEIEDDKSAGALARAEVLDVLAEALWRAGKSRDEDAPSIPREAISIKTRIYGQGHPKVADSQRHLAIMYEDRGQKEEARALYGEIIATRQATAGPESPQLARALVDLGNFLYTAGDSREAESLYRRALAIQETVLEPNDVQLALTLNNLAGLRLRLYDFEGAKPLYERALEIRRSAQGEDHIDLTWTLNGLALLHEDLGEYAEALALHERVLEIRREVLGPEHIRVAGSLNNLASVYRLLGAHETAIDLIEQAVAVSRKVDDQPFTAMALSNLADVLALEGDLEQAVHLSRKALEMRRGALGEEHPAYAWNLNSLAHLLVAQERLDDALPLLEESLRLHEYLLGSEHPVVARTLENLGELSFRSGDPRRSASQLGRALAIQETALGADHPEVGRTLSALGPLQASLGEEPEALQSALRAEEIGRRHLRVTAETLVESQALGYAEVRSSGWNLAACLAARGVDSEALRSIWDGVIRSRALVLDEMIARTRTVSVSKDPELAELAAELAQASRQLSSLLLATIGAGEVGAHRESLEKAMGARLAAERNLAQHSAEYRRSQHRRRIGFSEVAASLPDSTALVAFVAYGAPLSGCMVSDHEHRKPALLAKPEDGYLAFVLRDGLDGPRAVPLGTASRIDPLIEGWSRQILSGPAAESQGSGKGITSYLSTAAALREAIWDPLTPFLGDTERVLLVPDGALHRVSFVSLPTGDRSFLLETGPTLHYLTAERDVVPPLETAPRGSGLLAIGGPDFGSHSLAPGDDAELETTRSGCAPAALNRFSELPASVEEVEEVMEIWTRTTSRTKAEKHTVLIGSGASEAAFKAKAPGQRVLHLATHGYSLGHACRPELPATRGIGGLADWPGPGSSASATLNPALLSGLAMAGANLRHLPDSDSEDGLLTAEEVASLQLQGVEWAVLSACETGLGDISSSLEGVLGLQRAFRVAGAESLIMSLWPVADQATHQWMRGLYLARLEAGAGTARAAREAGLRVLGNRRKNSLSTHPFFWAAFVSIGNWN